MKQGCWVRVLGCLVLLVGLSSVTGCDHLFQHQVGYTPAADSHAEPPPVIPLSCQDVPPCCKDHVHVFIIHGTDPFDWANLNGMIAYLRELGFRKTYLGQIYHRNEIIREVRKVQCADPEARFVLIGFSFGANMVRDVARAVKPDGAHIDLLVYLGGNTLEDTPRDRPENAGKVVNILAQGFIWNGTTFSEGENIQLTDVFHFGSPMHAYTRDMLAHELTIIAAGVPIITPAANLPGGPSFDEPTPRPVQAKAAGTRDEWDFLKPAGHLQTPLP